MLQIRELTITHKKDLRVLLKDFNLVLNNGDKAVVIGEEGNGKSTLVKWIFRPESISAYADASGTRMIGGEKLACLQQELPEEDREKTVYSFFSENVFFADMTPRELATLAKRFSLDADVFFGEQKMQTLSGGEKIKLQLMRILIGQPTVLLLDEPSNDIDITTLELLEDVINAWKGIVLYISHDETLIENTANMVVHLEQLKRKTEPKYTVAKKSYRDYINERLQAYEIQERQAMSDLREKKKRDEKFRRIYQSVDSALSNVSRQDPATAKSLKDKMHTVKSMGRRFEREDEQMRKRPETENAIYFELGGSGSEVPAGKRVLEYELAELCSPDENGEKRVLARNIKLNIRGAEKVCIAGANGCGKTTLLKLIAEYFGVFDENRRCLNLPALSEEIHRLSTDVKQNGLRAEYMPQNYEDMLDMQMTPVEYLTWSGNKEEQTRIRTYLGSLKYTVDEMEHPIRELSGGQKAKVLLLKMSLSHANVLLLDEPSRNFSPLSGPVIRQMIRSFPGAVISVSHDRKYIDEVCDRVYELTGDGLKEMNYGK